MSTKAVVSSAVCIVTLTALQLAVDSKGVNLDSKSFRDDLKESAGALLAKKEPRELLGQSFSSFINGLRVDGAEAAEIAEDVDLTILASSSDSTNITSSTCYSNCYSDWSSHSARSWR